MRVIQNLIYNLYKSCGVFDDKGELVLKGCTTFWKVLIYEFDDAMSYYMED